MGRTKSPKTNQKGGRGSKQIRLVQMLKPRRSARLSSDLSVKKGVKDKFQCRTECKDDVDIQLLEVEAEQGKSITLLPIGESRERQDVNSPQRKSKFSPVKVDVNRDEDEDWQLLKQFDMNPLYGPCRGISRRERYFRALKYKIKPTPNEIILAILDKHLDDFAFQKCIWDQNELLKLHI